MRSLQWYKRGAAYLCGFIIEPAIHSHNLRVKKKRENAIV